MKWTFGQKALVGMPFVVIVVVCVFVVAPSIMASSPATTRAMELLRKCPRAVELLGKNAEPARTGLGCGCEDEGGAHHMVRVRGSKGSGVLEVTADKESDRLVLTRAEILLDNNERIDLLRCGNYVPPAVPTPTPEPPPPPPPSPDDAGVPVDAYRYPVEQKRTKLLFEFTATVDRTTHPTLMPYVECTGTIRRAKGDWRATGRIDCDGKTLYAGASPIMLDRGAEEGQVRLDYFDDASATKAKLSFADRDIVRVWSEKPLWEVELKVTAEKVE